MENFRNLLISRRSTRKYTEEPLSPEQVHLILEAALLSPAGKSKNPWEFVLVEDKEMLMKLSVAKEHGAGPLKNAALAVVVIGDATKADTWVEDCSIASTLIQLQCENLGLGSCWIQMNKRYNEAGYLSEDIVRELLDIPPYLNVLSIISIGHKAEEKAPKDLEKLQWEKVHIAKFTNE